MTSVGLASFQVTPDPVYEVHFGSAGHGSPLLGFRDHGDVGGLQREGRTCDVSLEG